MPAIADQPSSDRSRLQQLSDLFGADSLRELPDLEGSNLSERTYARCVAQLLNPSKEQLQQHESASLDSYRRFFPFSTVDQLEAELSLLGYNRDAVTIDRGRGSGTGDRGLAERVAIAWHHDFQQRAETDKEKANIRDWEMLSSRLADREPPEGTLISLSDGLHQVERTFASGGAFVICLVNMDSPECIRLVCRGTALRPSATEGFRSAINDIHRQIGFPGVEAVWPQIHAYLKERKPSSLELIGKSLGAGHAAQLTVRLLENGLNVNRLITVGGVGVGEQVNEQFKTLSAELTESLHLIFLRNSGPKPSDHDFVPLVGGVHLGYDVVSPNVRRTVYYLGALQQAPVPALDLSGLSKLRMSTLFLKSFDKSHLFQVTFGDFAFHKIEDPDEVNRHLELGRTLEPFRQVACKIAKALAFGPFKKLLKI